jgi:Lrp/AsnC family transcriptional regulator for asnA, asnC and gidA
MAKIDDIDRKILSELMADGAISIPKLSKNINANSSVVYSRIKRLLKRKLIERYTIQVNEKELGYGVKSVTGINMNSKLRDNVIDELFKIDGVSEISEVTGRFDIMVTMHTKNLNDMHQIVSEKIGKIDGIIGSESFIEMKRRTKPMPFLNPE